VDAGGRVRSGARVPPQPLHLDHVRRTLCNIGCCMRGRLADSASN
jgi:hypothetical protein